MANKRPNSRQGKPNKNKKFLLNRLQDMYGDDFHPIMRMAEAATKMNHLIDQIEQDAENGDPKEYLDKLFFAYRANIEAWGKIAEYTEPKLRAVEVKHDNRPKVKLIDLRGKTVDPDVIDADDPKTIDYAGNDSD